LYEDAAFFFKMHLAAPTFVSDACWMKYRQHPESCMARSPRRGDYYSRRRPLLEWLHAYIGARGVDPRSEIAQAVRRELWRARHPRLHRVAARARSLLARAVRP
jgi:hypothetical protein